MELARKKANRTNHQVFDQGENLGLLFKSRFWSHRQFQAELKCRICDIYTRGTARKQFSLDSTIWESQEDNDAKHT